MPGAVLCNPKRSLIYRFSIVRMSFEGETHTGVWCVADLTNDTGV